MVFASEYHAGAGRPAFFGRTELRVDFCRQTASGLLPIGNSPADSAVRRNRLNRRILFRLLATIAACGLGVAPADRCEAADWVFRPSYFSHPVPPELAWRYPYPESLSAYRPAIVSPYPGFALQGVTRFNNVAIPSGASFDYTLMRSQSFRRIP